MKFNLPLLTIFTIFAVLSTFTLSSPTFKLSSLAPQNGGRFLGRIQRSFKSPAAGNSNREFDAAKDTLCKDAFKKKYVDHGRIVHQHIEGVETVFWDLLPILDRYRTGTKWPRSPASQDPAIVDGFGLGRASMDLISKQNFDFNYIRREWKSFAKELGGALHDTPFDFAEVGLLLYVLNERLYPSVVKCSDRINAREMWKRGGIVDYLLLTDLWMTITGASKYIELLFCPKALTSGGKDPVILFRKSSGLQSALSAVSHPHCHVVDHNYFGLPKVKFHY
ncbi:hypothetical protein BJ508DRAFT_304906 [Ascobolus immersus RN42]|uniref:Uncharacterized protein n=1 Tax=Ascobolus immersus RN42 TaxID=1160509 RepID=A0A3N4ICJ4_ASCIM|nr:hypothetical protein BJ508DRAFT_304906 [Ascobolus immersus RN42]